MSDIDGNLSPPGTRLAPLLARIEAGEIKPDVIISHRLSLSDAPAAYDNFLNKQDDFTKVVLQP